MHHLFFCTLHVLYRHTHTHRDDDVLYFHLEMCNTQNKIRVNASVAAKYRSNNVAVRPENSVHNSFSIKYSVWRQSPSLVNDNILKAQNTQMANFFFGLHPSDVFVIKFHFGAADRQHPTNLMHNLHDIFGDAWDFNDDADSWNMKYCNSFKYKLMLYGTSLTAMLC